MKMKASKGQATIEALIASISVFGLLFFFLATFYFLSLKAHLQFTSHELLVCHQFRDASTCNWTFQKELKNFMRFGKMQSFQVQRSSNRQSIELHLLFNFQTFEKFGFRGFPWIYKDQISLPLKKS